MSKKINIPARAKTNSEIDKWVDQSSSRSTTSSNIKPKRLTLDLDPNLHRRLKLHCVERETDIASLLRGLIEETLK